jgi:3-hydroxybutyryl-CoA dehydrogenase
VTIAQVGVVGGGLMGSGIAEVCARAGCQVIVSEASAAAAEAARDRVAHSLDRAVEAGKLEKDARDDALLRLSFTDDLSRLSESDLVVEAVVEDEATKIEVFRALDAVVTSPNAVLASNTSSIPIMKLAMVTSRPERVMGLHFFNPVPVLDLVEQVSSLLTDEAVADTIEVFVREQLGKTVVRSADRAGFIVNALLIPYLLSAVRMLESGFSSAEDIDAAMMKGCAHPMGPLHLSDLIGLDTMAAVAASLYEEFKEPLYAAPPLLSRMAEAGLIGRKVGRGFFTYGRSKKS